MGKQITHLVYVPFTGLGLYNGFRGNRWLRNRIAVFKEYTCRALEAQTNKDFTIWVSWRHQERSNPQVIELEKWLKQKFNSVVFTYGGVCFWDDKYKPEEARARLIDSLHKTMGELVDHITGEEVLMTLQPSDDCYYKGAIEEIQKFFEENPDYSGFGYQKGYIMNYSTKEISEYNPKTNPPFYTIKFKKEVFIDPLPHLQHTGPYESHEYVPDFTKYYKFDKRGFVVGTHGENISTYYDHPFKGDRVDNHFAFVPYPSISSSTAAFMMSPVVEQFGLENAGGLKFNVGWKRWILKKLPHRVRRKLRYWFNEKLYNFLRS